MISLLVLLLLNIHSICPVAALLLNCIYCHVISYTIDSVIGGYPRCEYRLQDNLWYSPLSRNCIY